MKLYHSAKHHTTWFAFGSAVGWVTFPAEVGGWNKRQPARNFDRLSLHEIPLRMGFNTGIPGAPMAARAADPSLKTAA